MNFIKFLFSSNGEINRTDFLIISLFLIIISSITIYFTIDNLKIINYFITLVSLYAYICLSVKRLRNIKGEFQDEWRAVIISFILTLLPLINFAFWLYLLFTPSKKIFK